MPRQPRIEYSGAIYHITTRGDNKENIFIDEKDRWNFLSILKDITKKYNWLNYCYCLMNNHYHLLIKTPDANLSKGMKQLNGIYTQRFNKKHNRVGHVFQGRYNAKLVQKENYLMVLIRYIMLNPVRAGLINSPEKWKWSSYNEIIENYGKSNFIAKDFILSQFSSKKNEAIDLFKKFICSAIKEDKLLDKFRKKSIVGDNYFVERIKKMLNDEEKNMEKTSKNPKFTNRPKLDVIFEKNTKKEKRNKLIFTANFDYGYSQAEISRYLGVHYSTISKIINQIENQIEKHEKG